MAGIRKCVLKLGFTLLILVLLLHERHVNGSVSPAQWDSAHVPPSFDNHTSREHTITVGQTANLVCKVRNLGDRAVSWIRKHDLHIITIGTMAYTNDQRFEAIHAEGSNAWTLRISSGQPRDSAIYECQVSTEPKISLAYRLTVVVAKAKIQANPEMFYKSGSDINLTCTSEIVSRAPPSFIYWYKDGDLMNYSQRGGINVLTEQQTARSTLLISKATASDSGNYTCFPSNTNSDSVMVHVIKNEHRAAMQHENSGVRSTLRSLSTGGSASLCLPAVVITVATVLQPIRSAFHHPCRHFMCSWWWRFSQTTALMIVVLNVSLRGLATAFGSSLWSWLLINVLLMILMLMLVMTIQRSIFIKDASSPESKRGWFLGDLWSAVSTTLAQAHSSLRRSGPHHNWKMVWMTPSAPRRICGQPQVMQEIPTPQQPTDIAATTDAAVAAVATTPEAVYNETNTQTRTMSSCLADDAIVIWGCWYGSCVWGIRSVVAESSVVSR